MQKCFLTLELLWVKVANQEAHQGHLYWKSDDTPLCHQSTAISSDYMYQESPEKPSLHCDCVRENSCACSKDKVKSFSVALSPIILKFGHVDLFYDVFNTKAKLIISVPFSVMNSNVKAFIFLLRTEFIF